MPPPRLRGTQAEYSKASDFIVKPTKSILQLCRANLDVLLLGACASASV